MNDKEIVNLLTETGMSGKEVAVYLAALELGSGTILQISEKSNIKRPTVYEVMPSLEARGVMRRTPKGKKLIFTPEDPKMILSALEKKAKIFESVLPELAAIFNSKGDKPKVYFYEGREQLEKMYDDTLAEGQPILNFTSIVNLYTRLDRNWVERYIRKRVELGIGIRIIAIDSPEAREWEKNAKEELRKIKLIPRKNVNFAADMQIYGNKIIIATYDKNLFGLIIEDVNIAQIQKLSFEIMWGAL